MFLPCNLNMSFNLPCITSNCVEIVQNSVEVKRITLKNVNMKKKKKKKIDNAFQNTHCRTAFEDLKVHRLILSLKLKYTSINNYCWSQNWNIKW